LHAWIVELKGDAITFLDQLVIQGVGFPKSALPILVIMAMLAGSMIVNKDFLDIPRSMVDIFAVLVDAI
jgi:hypothetical protein